MTHRFPVFADTSGTITSDSGATGGTLVERDANANSGFNGVALGAAPTGLPSNKPYHSNAGSDWQAGATQTTNFTLDNTSPKIQKCNATGGAITGTLPAASTVANQMFTLFKSDSSGNAVTVKGNGTDNITVGATTANTTSLATQGASVKLWCDGTQWWAL